MGLATQSWSRIELWPNGIRGEAAIKRNQRSKTLDPCRTSLTIARRRPTNCQGELQRLSFTINPFLSLGIFKKLHDKSLLCIYFH